MSHDQDYVIHHEKGDMNMYIYSTMPNEFRGILWFSGNNGKLTTIVRTGGTEREVYDLCVEWLEENIPGSYNISPHNSIVNPSGNSPSHT